MKVEPDDLDGLRGVSTVSTTEMAVAEAFLSFILSQTRREPGPKGPKGHRIMAM